MSIKVKREIIIIIIIVFKETNNIPLIKVQEVIASFLIKDKIQKTTYSSWRLIEKITMKNLVIIDMAILEFWGLNVEVRFRNNRLKARKYLTKR